jgi:adenosylhomocysteine nucleosidase
MLLVWSGIGANRAGVAAKRLLEHNVTALLSWGCAAALSERLVPGSLVLPNTVIAADGTVFAVDPSWQGQLHAGLASQFPTVTGALAETRDLLAVPAQKHALSQRTKAIAADMESAALGALAQKAGIAFAVIRAIADSVDMIIPRVAMGAIDDRGQINLAGMITGLICYPQEWFTLARLSRGFRAAKATLARIAAHSDQGLLVPLKKDLPLSR